MQLLFQKGCSTTGKTLEEGSRVGGQESFWTQSELTSRTLVLGGVWREGFQILHSHQGKWFPFNTGMWKWECGRWFGQRGRAFRPNLQQGISAWMARTIRGYWESFAPAPGGCRGVGWWHHRGLASPVCPQLGALSCPRAHGMSRCVHKAGSVHQAFPNPSMLAVWAGGNDPALSQSAGSAGGICVTGIQVGWAGNILAVLSFPQKLPLELGMFLQLS